MFCFHAGFPGSPVLLFFAFKFSQESRMLQKALVVVLVLASIAASTGCGGAANHYVYATLPAANELAVYREDPNSGVLTQISGSPYSVGDGAHYVVLHPSGKFLYVANPGTGGALEDDISLFTIASDGTLTEQFPRASIGQNASQPQILAMDPAGKYLYVANTQSSNISVFSIDSSSGTLTQLANSPFSIGLPMLNMQLTSSGKYLYVSAASGSSGLPGWIAGFSVNAGALTRVSLTSSDGVNPYGLAIDPTGNYLYAGNTSSNSISIFSGANTGTLQEVPQFSPFADTYQDPVALLLDSKGQYLYVANQVSNNVAVYSIDSSTGLPTALTTTTTTFAFGTEDNPSFLALDPSGKYLFVANQGTSAGIESFGISSGNLTSLFTYNVGNTPSSIAVLQ
jgi:6-phosphogluconolactonase (cycloisomerase 2 family)